MIQNGQNSPLCGRIFIFFSKTKQKKLFFASSYDILLAELCKKRIFIMNLSAVIMNLLAPASSDAIYVTYRIVSFVLIALMFLAAVAAIVLVLLTPGNSQGIDALGGSSETFYGKNKGQSREYKLKKWTTICLIILAVLSIVFFILQIDAIWTA